MTHPVQLGMGLVVKFAGLEQGRLEPGGAQQESNLTRSVFAVVSSLGLFVVLSRADVGAKESGMIALQDGADATHASDVRRCQHQVTTGPKNAVDLGHQEH